MALMEKIRIDNSDLAALSLNVAAQSLLENSFLALLLEKDIMDMAFYT